MPSETSELPVDAVLPELRDALAHGPVVLQAPTGSGKTTRVPPALVGPEGWVVVVEPRRVAVRAAARRVASELGCRVGEQVGYQIRDDRRIGPSTRIVFVTEGILLRWLVSDPFLERVATVVLDEFHERSVDLDLAVSLLRAVREVRDDLGLVVMSATLQAEPLVDFLGARVVHSEGRTHPVAIEHVLRPPTEPLSTRVESALASLPPDGDVLVFLPGRREIDDAMHLPGALPLHGGLSSAEQDAVFTRAAHRRVILATNVAESSLTVPGIRFVIDSGLVRQPRIDTSTGLDRLEVVPIAVDSADQRAGRAGRLGPGHAIRLWTAADHRDRPAETLPAIHRVDLAPALLALLAYGEPDPAAFAWFDAPASHRIDAALELLFVLGAYDGGLTPLGRELAGLPLHPRLGRFVLEGRSERAARWALWLSEGGRPQGDLTRIEPPRHDRASRLAPGGRGDLAQAALSAWPDRVARQRGDGAVMANGHGVVGCSEPWFVAVGLHAAATGRRGEAKVELYAPIDPDWLEPTERVVSRMEGERVQTFTQQLRGGLVLNEHPAPLDEATAAPILLEEVLRRGIVPAKWESWQHRLAFARGRADLPEDLETQVLAELCRRHRTVGAVKNAAGGPVLLELLTWPQRQALEKIAPERIDAGGRSFRLDWTAEGPVLAARIQHLFKVPRTPELGGEPVLVHLLAPNGRPQQITRDLAGFWASTYFEVRKELRHRYPKHAWPEDPLGSA